jgi:hypothetical protein
MEEEGENEMDEDEEFTHENDIERYLDDQDEEQEMKD